MEELKIHSPNGIEHTINVSIQWTWNCIFLTAVYVDGGSGIHPDTKVAQWSAAYEDRNEFDAGQVMIGDGRIDLEIESLQGIGLGSLLMLPIIRWIKQKPPVPVALINLSAEDAKTTKAQKRRNRFYEKLGFEFDYQDSGIWGESRPMTSDKLITPIFKLSNGWKVESVDCVNSVF